MGKGGGKCPRALEGPGRDGCAWRSVAAPMTCALCLCGPGVWALWWAPSSACCMTTGPGRPSVQGWSRPGRCSVQEALCAELATEPV